VTHSLVQVVTLCTSQTNILGSGVNVAVDGSTRETLPVLQVKAFSTGQTNILIGKVMFTMSVGLLGTDIVLVEVPCCATDALTLGSTVDFTELDLLILRTVVVAPDVHE
jgi:hypothetical protein